MKSNVLLVGNFLDPSRHSPGVGLEFACLLQASGRQVIMVSNYQNRLLRLADMVWMILWHQKAYQVAQVDIFSGLAFLWAEIACWALRLIRKPYILTLRGGNLPVFAARWPSRVKRLLTSAAIVTAPSRFLYEEMRLHCQSLEFLPNPIHLSAYTYKVRDQMRPLLVWLRAFHKIYNPGLAPRVLAILAPEFPASRLAMIGPDKGDGSLLATRQIAHDLGVECMITYPGAVLKSKVPEILQTGDIFINTTNIDNTPVSVMEAMACGLCIVSTNVGGIPYLLTDGEDALLVPPDDPQAMANAIQRILTEPSLAARLSANARKKVDQFDWQVIFPKWEALFEGVINA